MTSNDVPESVWKALERSGFPFQTAVANLIRSSTSDPAMPRLIEEEWPWSDRGTERFVDIIAQKSHSSFAIIECKKTREDWIFLHPDASGQRLETRAARIPYSSKIDAQGPDMLLCAQAHATPASVESGFCVVSSRSNGGKQRLLEVDVRTLIRGTEAFAQVLRQRLHVGSRLGEFYYVPVLVTTAGLYSAHYDPTQISLSTGMLDRDVVDLRPEPWVRLTKHLMSDREFPQTALIVSGQHLLDFLHQFMVHGVSPHEGADPIDGSEREGS